MPFHANDYVSPNFEVIDVDFAFPNLANGPPETAPWSGAYEVGPASGIASVVRRRKTRQCLRHPCQLPVLVYNRHVFAQAKRAH